MELRATLKEKKRIVIKVGTSTVTYAKTGNINLEKLEKFVRVLINLRNRGKEIIVVSSGAVGIGKNVLGISEKPAGSVKQACAAVGQGRLMMIYEKFFCGIQSAHRTSAADERICLQQDMPYPCERNI